MKAVGFSAGLQLRRSGATSLRQDFRRH